MDWQAAIHGFDGSVEELKAAARGFPMGEVAALYDYLESEAPEHRVAATWIVKALLEQGAALDGARVFVRLREEEEWGALLHLLQSVQFAPQAAAPYRAAIEAHLNHPKTFVAVWALDALVRVSVETGEGEAQARELVNAALSAKQASKRARARYLAPLLGL